MKTAPFSFKLLHPRYWLVWCGLGCMVLLAQLPFRWQMISGVWLGRLMYRLAHRRRQICERNIELCFPEWSDIEREDFVRRHFETMGVTVFEMGMSWFMPYSRLEKRFEIQGLEHWQALKAEGKGALVIGMHFNTLEIANGPVNRLFNLYMTYRPHNNPAYDFVQCLGRERHNPNAGMVDRRDVRGMVKVLKQGDWLWYVPDQDYGIKVSEFVPFFGIDAATVAATPRLLRMAKVPAVGITFKRKADLSGYVITLLPPFDHLPSGDDNADLLRLNQHFESCIRENPIDYLWTHRRFKTRPKGESSLYPNVKRKRR